MLKVDKFKQLKAIEESIAKWEKKEIFAKKGKVLPSGGTGCPLCLLNRNHSCYLCPIVAYGDEKDQKMHFCEKTPYLEYSLAINCRSCCSAYYSKALLLKAIREEIKFLKKVRTFWKKKYRLYKTKEK